MYKMYKVIIREQGLLRQKHIKASMLKLKRAPVTFVEDTALSFLLLFFLSTGK